MIPKWKVDSGSSHPVFSENALTVLQERYLRRDEAGDLVESPAEMLERVASAVAAPGKIFGDDVPYGKSVFSSGRSGLSFCPIPPRS
jgi:ribonucleoside-diphosphate reductase alpha chain